MLRKLICTGLWLGATGLTVLIVCQGMATQSEIVTGIGILGVCASSTGLYLAADAFSRNDRLAGVASIGIWLCGALFLVPTEISFWASRVNARIERESDLKRQTDARRGVMDNLSGVIIKQKPPRSSAEVGAAIDLALASKIKAGKVTTTLAAATNNCTAVQSPVYGSCTDVLKLRSEKVTAEAYEKSTAMLWNAGQQVVDTNSEHGAHDGVAFFERNAGGSMQGWSDGLLLVTVMLLMFMRDWPLFIGFRKSPAVAPMSLTVANITPDTSPAPLAAISAIATVAAIPDAEPVIEPVKVSEHRPTDAAVEKLKEELVKPLSTDELVEEALHRLPYGVIHNADIEKTVSKVCSESGRPALTREPLRNVIRRLDLKKVKKDAVGARYFNHLGHKEEAGLARVA